ncbi:MAG: T9SS type A sorting domain-containing protein [Ignavibacteriae bacterium]|nr:T9SS type A sorting domain-containing protein [Ignavibacteriota bacterium]
MNKLFAFFFICLTFCFATTFSSAQTDKFIEQAQVLMKDYAPPATIQIQPTETPVESWQEYYRNTASITSLRYATSVIAYSSQYGSSVYAATQALGAPDVYPSYGINGKSWASLTGDGQREYLVLSFDNPEPVTSVGIYETYRPGAVDTIYVKNPDTGLWEVVWKSAAGSKGDSARFFLANFTTTAFDVSEIRLAINSPAVSGFNQIDAVVLSATPIRPIRVNTMPSNSKSTSYANALVNVIHDVWGNVHGGTSPYKYYLFYGDGAMDSGNVTDAHNIAKNHTYATAGPKTMKLIVTDALGRSDSDQSVIQVFASSTQQIRVNMAIEKGLRYLYLNQYSTGYWADNSNANASTGMALLAFEENGHLPVNDIDDDIYSEYVRKGLNYLFGNATTMAMTPQTAGIPDINGNGLGVYVSTNTYANGMGILGIIGAHLSAASAKNDTIPVGAYKGKTFYDFVVDAVDQWCYSQTDAGWPRGGWRYNVNTSSNGDADNSTTQWPALDMEAAEKSWGVPVPQWVKNEMLYVLQYSQHASGGFGYQNVDWLNITKTAAGIGDYAFLGYTTAQTPVANAISYINSSWSLTGDDGAGGWKRHLEGNTYAMYGVAKGMRIINNRLGEHMIGTHDWYAEYVTHLLDHATWKQNANGSWPRSGNAPTSYMGDPLNSSLAILVLTQGVVIPPPIAVIAPLGSKPPNKQFRVDGSGSYHLNPEKNIVEWLWDFDASDGVDWDEPDAFGPVPTNPGYADTGTYTVTLRVMDNSDPPMFDIESKMVKIQTYNNKPIAVSVPEGRAPTYAGKAGEPILLDANDSFDPDPEDSVIAYKWDLDGDGGFDDAFTDTVTVVFNEDYQGQVGVRVFDTFGDSSENNSYVNIVTSGRDISVVHFSVSPYTISRSSSLNVFAIFKNDDSSDNNISAALVRFYDGNPLTIGNQLGGDFYVSLPVGGMDTVGTTLTIAENFPLGPHRIYVYLDANRNVGEWNEVNNFRFQRISVKDSVSTYKYRTATVQQWALSKDSKGKYKSEKCKPIAVDFAFPLSVDSTIVGDKLTVELSMKASGIIKKAVTSETLATFSNAKKVVSTFTPPLDSGTVLIVEGMGVKGSKMKAKYAWGTIKKKKTVPDSVYTKQLLLLPMPNLHNVGEDLTILRAFPFTVGATYGAHSVALKKYANAQNSLYKKRTFHTGAPRCLDTLKNGKPFSKQQKELPPQVHDNKLFAEQLALKMNILASSYLKFPYGLADLLYDNSNDDPNDLFNGDRVEDIANYVDQFLNCGNFPKGTDSTIYLSALQRINSAFADSTVDTTCWSCTRLMLTGVRTVNDVSFLRESPTAKPHAEFLPVPSVELPEEFSLEQNYPNPFNPTTNFGFRIANFGLVTLKVFNTLGQEIATVLNREEMEEGEYEFPFEASNLPSGVYFYRIAVESVDEEGVIETFTDTKKMLLLR